MHTSHKVLDIEDQESLKKENITIESCVKDFNENIKKIINLKDKIEQEIQKIDNIYNNVFKEITKSYELKHEKLTKEENDLKERLQNEVTKTKEQLEHFLSESNNVIKTNDKINKGLNIIEKDENKSMIKILAYISKISKNQKEMKKLFNELIKNKNISFIKENNTVKYEEYIFNGIPIPKNIEVKDIGKNYFKLFWKIDDVQINNNKNNFLNILSK